MRIIFVTIIAIFLSSTCRADVIAGIEIGSKGIKAMAINYSGLNSQGQQRYKIVLREDIKADVIDKAVDGNLDEKKISEAAAAIGVLFDKIKRFDPQYFAIVASTAFNNYKNRNDLENAIFDKVQKKVVFITSDEEIGYALQASDRAKYAFKCVLIDIGSGNTKIGYASPMSANGYESTRIKFGTKSLSDQAKKMGGDYQENLKQIVRNEIIPAVREAVSQQPGISNVSRRIYIEGGASWAVASYAQPKNINKAYNYLKLKEIYAVVRKFQNNDLKVKISSEEAENTFLKIGDNFDVKQLQAGSLILKTILTEINAAQRAIVFNRNGGWIIGYLIGNYKAMRERL